MIGALIRASLTGLEQFGEVFLQPFIKIQWPRFRTCALPMDVLSIADARVLCVGFQSLSLLPCRSVLSGPSCPSLLEGILQGQINPVAVPFVKKNERLSLSTA